MVSRRRQRIPTGRPPSFSLLPFLAFSSLVLTLFSYAFCYSTPGIFTLASADEWEEEGKISFLLPQSPLGIAANTVTLDDIVTNYRSLLSSALSSYAMNCEIMCTSGACMSNPSAFVAGIEVNNIPLVVSDSGRSVSGYPDAPREELYTMLSNADSPSLLSVEDGNFHKFPLKLDYTRFVNGSAQAMFVSNGLLPSMVGRTSLEALMYYGSRQGSGVAGGSDPATYWFDAGAAGPTAAGSPIAEISDGSFTVSPPITPEAQPLPYAMQLTNFSNISYRVQFSAFESVTLNASSAAGAVMVPTEYRVREIFNQYYYDRSELDAEGRPTVKRLPGPPGAVVSNWYVQLSRVTPTSFSPTVVSDLEKASKAKDQWHARRSAMQNYSFLMSVSCEGSGCGVSPTPEFVWPDMGIVSNWTVAVADERITHVMYPFIDDSGFTDRDLTFDVDARAVSKTMTELFFYSSGLTNLNKMANGYPSAGMVLREADGLVEELWYKFDDAFRAADSYPSFLGYDHVSRDASSVPLGFSSLVPVGPPSKFNASVTNRTALYRIRTSKFTPNANFTLIPPDSGDPYVVANDDGGGISTTLIITIVCVVAFVVICIIILIICLCCLGCCGCGKTKNDEEHHHHHHHHTHGEKDFENDPFGSGVNEAQRDHYEEEEEEADEAAGGAKRDVDYYDNQHADVNVDDDALNADDYAEEDTTQYRNDNPIVSYEHTGGFNDLHHNSPNGRRGGGGGGGRWASRGGGTTVADSRHTSRTLIVDDYQEGAVGGDEEDDTYQGNSPRVDHHNNTNRNYGDDPYVSDSSASDNDNDNDNDGNSSAYASGDDGMPTLGHEGAPYRDERYNYQQGSDAHEKTYLAHRSRLSRSSSFNTSAAQNDSSHHYQQHASSYYGSNASASSNRNRRSRNR